jgi:hypothetical protein
MARTRSLAPLIVLGCCANAAALELAPNEPERDLAPHIRYLLTTGSPFEDAARIAALPASAFAPLPGATIDLDIGSKTLWLSLDVDNGATQAAGTWRLATDIAYSPDLAIYQVRRGELVALLEHSRESRYEDRPVDYRLLAVDFSLDAGETGRLLLGRRFGPAALSLTIESAESFAARQLVADVAAACIYAALAFAILFTALQYAVLGDRVQLAYLALISAATLALADHDGFTFQYHLWPSAGWYSPIGVPLLAAVSVTMVQFTRTFVRTARLAPRFDRFLLAAMLVSCAAYVAELIWSQQSFGGELARLSFDGLVLLCLGASIHAYVRGQKTVRFYLLGWIAAVLALALQAVLLARAEPDFRVVQYGFSAAVVLNLLAFLLAITDQALETQRERHAALRRELASRLDQRELSEQLRAAETARLEALLNAARQAARLTTTTHDLKQPLLALRLAIEQLRTGGNGDSVMIEQLEAGVADLDRLATGVLERSPVTELPAELSTFRVQLVLDALTQMFRDQAERNGWRFRCRSSTACVQGQALDVIRVLGTQIDRIVAHAGRGSLLLGCRRCAGRLRFYVGASSAHAEAGRDALEAPTELAAAHGARGRRIWTLDLPLASS